MTLAEPLGAGTLSCITELFFSSASCHGNFPKIDHFLQILRAASNLQFLRLENYVFSKRGGAEICRALEQKLILQHLQRISIIYQWDDPDYNRKVRQDQKNCFSVYHRMIILCPKLTTL